MSVVYLTPLGLILAFIFGDRENSRFHLNQALVLCIVDILLSVIIRICSHIPLVRVVTSAAGGLLGLVLFIFWIIGFASAISGTEKKVPILGEIELLK